MKAAKNQFGTKLAVRKIKQEEMMEFNKIGTVAFASSRDFSEELKNPLAFSAGFEHTWGAFQDGIMTAGLWTLPYEVSFDGKIVPMAGIGTVASLPQYRGKGAIGQILYEAMKEMKDKGQMFSYLYPFSHEFYRKFGYEMGFQRRVAHFPLSGLKDRKPVGQLSFFQKGDALLPYQQIHDIFISHYNLAIKRSEAALKDFLDQDSYSSKQYTYLWHSPTGTAKSYVTFKPEQGNENGFQMKICDFAWMDSEGLQGMLSWLGRFEAQYKEVCWEVPDGVDIFALLSEPFDTQVRLECGGMNRIIDAQKVLEGLKVPEGEGQAVIQVMDGFLPWNNGIYYISWSGGKLVVINTEQVPDTAVSIQVLTRLATGYYTPATAELSGHLKIAKNSRGLNKLFIKKNAYLNDRF